MRLIDIDELFMTLHISGSKESCAGCPHASYHYSLCIDDLPLSEVCKVICEQPAVDAIPVRHGKWIDLNTRLCSYSPLNRYKCSVCGERSDNFKYCPNCGARMDK